MPMDKVITPNEAWDDFFVWIKTQPAWAAMALKDKQYIYRANSDRAKGWVIDRRIKTILEKHAPARYEFRGVVIIHE